MTSFLPRTGTSYRVRVNTVTVAVVSYVEDALICYYAYLPVAAARERGVKASGFQRAQIYFVQSAYSYLFFIKSLLAAKLQSVLIS